MFRSVSSSARTMAFGKRNSGMPYTSTPPALWKASNSTTSWPARRTSAATVMPAGPLPTTATFLPVAGATTGGAAAPWARSQSAT